MNNVQNIIIGYIKKATGKTDVGAIDFKDIEKVSKENIYIKKVRGNVRMMSGKIKTHHDVEDMKSAFIALEVP